jgi:hypothetical protein
MLVESVVIAFVWDIHYMICACALSYGGRGADLKTFSGGLLT